MKCLNCEIEFTPQRKTAQFHDPKCRVAYNRKKVESLPGYIKPDSTPEEILAKVKEISSKKENSSVISNKPEKPQPQEKKVEGNVPSMERIMAEINKEYGAGTAMRGSDLLKMERFSTGISTLDEKMGGGFPKGRIVELYGQPMTGKSLISLLTIVQRQKNGGKCVYFDCEDSFDPEWAEKLGVNMDRLDVMKISKGEDTFNMLFKMLEGRPDIIVVDSVDSMVIKDELEEDVEKAFMARKARLMSKAMRMLTPKNKGTLIIFINQLRSTMAMYGPKFVTPGGLALKFYSSIRLEVKKSEDIHEEGKKTLPIIGQVVSFKVDKNKTAVPQQIGSFKFFYDGKVEG